MTLRDRLLLRVTDEMGINERTLGVPNTPERVAEMVLWWMYENAQEIEDATHCECPSFRRILRVLHREDP